MNKYTYIIGGVIILLLGGFLLMQRADGEISPLTEGTVTPPQGKMVTGSALETFSGTITAVDTGCFSDMICSVSVDGKTVILVQGGRGMDPNTQVGKLVGVESIGDLEQKIGAHANVYATTTTDGGYSLYGNNDYYVEVVELENEQSPL